MNDLESTTLVLNRSSTTISSITAVSGSPGRPFCSAMIPVHISAGFISAASGSTLAQDLGKELMQIQVVDDASIDSSVESLAKKNGASRVEYYQPRNARSLRNFETRINSLEGYLVYPLYGSGRTITDFCKRVEGLLHIYFSIGAAFSQYAFMHTAEYLKEKENISNNWLLRIAQYQRIQYSFIISLFAQLDVWRIIVASTR